MTVPGFEREECDAEFRDVTIHRKDGPSIQHDEDGSP